jgi:hypothetical protein
MGSDAVVICRPLSSFPFVVRLPILSAVIVRRCRRPPSPLLSLAFTAVVIRRHRHPPPPSSASVAIIATPCLRRLLPPTLVRPLRSLPPDLACCCRPPLSLSAFAVVVCRRHLLPPQPSSPLHCLRCLSPLALVLPHRSPPPNHTFCRRPLPSSSATVAVRRRRTSTPPC